MSAAEARGALAPPVGVTPRVVEVLVRFSDVDGMRHVNNVVYLTYTEEARTRWAIEEVRAQGLDAIDFILARAEIDFLAPANLGDVVRVEMWVPRIGGKSWEFAYRLTDAATGRLLATARTVQVAYDYAAERSIEVPQALRRALAPYAARP